MPTETVEKTYTVEGWLGTGDWVTTDTYRYSVNPETGAVEEKHEVKTKFVYYENP